MLQVRTVFRVATLIPLLGLAIAAALTRPTAGLPAGWGYVYPTSVTRGLVVYAVLAAWLWRQLARRPLDRVRRFIWWVPVWYVALGWALMLGLSLLRGQTSELLSQHAGAIVLRTFVHLAVGYAYLVLLQLALRGLRRGGGVANGSVS